MNQEPSRSQRIMIPVNADADSRQGVAEVLRRQRVGTPLDVVLLHVAEPVEQWQVLCCMTRAEVVDFQSRSAVLILDEAARPLKEAGIPCRTLYRRGGVVPTILAVTAEEGCDEILLPPPTPRWRRLFSRDIVRRLRCR
ncbi:hypothetical protein MASR1M60_03820 [Rhodocyclaceae bacterium]